MYIVTVAEMREIDRRTAEEFGIPSLTLMENAGSAVAEFCLREHPRAESAGVICGKGNNGGDGLVAARKLHEAGKTVRVLLLADPADVPGDAAAMLKRLPVEPVIAKTQDELKSSGAQQVFGCDLLVDAILGTGFKPPLNDLYRSAVHAISSAQCGRVCVDVPSGVDADNKVEVPPGERVNGGDIVTFTAPKPFHVYGVTRGQVVVAEIGSPQQAVRSTLGQRLTTAGDILAAVAARNQYGNKGDYGHVLFIGGSLGKAGAAAMAGMAALRAGAGLVTVACPRSVVAIVSSFAPELMVEPLPETAEGSIALAALESGKVQQLAKGKTVVAIGPGATRNPET
ncbi:MAG TPA: NAD(P)H-hydrate epimerase, partial [Terriglobales bacterium]|nr:NAD(P)H-hydrate epimerase [Terriglobales bacterium]